MRDYMTKFSTQLARLKFQPRGLTILSCNRFNPGLKLFMSYSNMCGSDYLLQVFTSGNQCRERIAFQPGG